VQDALHRGEVRLPRIMYIETDLLDGVGDVGAVNIKYWRTPTRLLN
jgi:hypothetical protein